MLVRQYSVALYQQDIQNVHVEFKTKLNRLSRAQDLVLSLVNVPETSLEYNNVSRKIKSELLFSPELTQVYVGLSFENEYLDFIAKMSETKMSLVESEWREVEKLSDSFHKKQNALMYAFFLFFGFNIISFIYLMQKYFIAYRKANKVFNNIAKGKYADVDLSSVSSFGALFESIGKVNKGIKASTEFARAIGRREFDHEFKALSSDDILGNTLLEMREELKKVETSENETKWINTGLNSVSNISRENKENFESYCDEMLQYVVRYCDCLQGALYLSNEKVEMEMKACYAYGRKKFMQQKFSRGEGLIGQMINEKEKIFLKEVPQGYHKITSGLGKALPKNIVLLPLMNNGEIEGVLELSSFTLLSDSKIKFLEEVCNLLASEFFYMKNAQVTQKLLDESQDYAKRLQTQEEELRQSMEEISATHEEMSRIQKVEKEKTEQLLKELEESKSLLDRLLDTLPVGIFLKDKDLKMVLVNKFIVDKHKESKDQILGKSDADFFASDKSKVKMLFKEEHTIIESGITNVRIHQDAELEENKGEDRIFETYKIPMYINEEKGTGILGLQIDRTKQFDLKDLEK